MSDPYISRAMVIAGGVVFPIVDFAFIVTRVLIKRRRTGSLGIDDYLILMAFLHVCAVGGVSIYGAIKAGFGGSSPPVQNTSGINDQSDPTTTETRLLIEVYLLLIPTTFGSSKLSVLFFYRTIFQVRAFKIASWIAIGIVIAWIISTFLVTVTQCIPMSVLFTSAKATAQQCRPGFAIGFSTAVLDLATDLMIFTLPLYWVVKLQLPFWKKVSVIAAFLFGLVTVASCVYRLAELGIVYPNHNTDVNQWAYLTTLIFFGMIEAGLCVIAACLPTLGPLFSREGRARLLYRNQYHRSLTGRYSETSKSGKALDKHRRTTGDYPSETDSQTVLDGRKLGYDDAIGMNVVATANSSAPQRLSEHREGIIVTTDLNQESFIIVEQEDQR